MNFPTLEALLTKNDGKPLEERHEANAAIAAYFREVLANSYCKRQLEDLCKHHDSALDEYIGRIYDVLCNLLDSENEDYPKKMMRNYPPVRDMIYDWITDRSNILQDWVGEKMIFDWAQTIDIIDAAILIAKKR